ncbi:MAG: M28 family peptidase [Planctomycetes bacterium]|nr:M28 family peptidase [Planctomycetota bacterium]
MTLQEEVEALAQPEGRVVGTLGHEQARRHLVERLRAIGLSPYRGHTFGLPYRAAGRDFCNLIAVAPGRDPALAPVLIGAHYDSVIAAPCADDNAAAVAIALSAGEHFLREPAPCGIVIALFDAEEPGYFQTLAMGSIRFYEDQRLPVGFHAALIMDLVGHAVPQPTPEVGRLVPQFGRLLFITGAESHADLPGVASAARVPGLPVVATLNRRVGDMSDHRIFRLNGVPYLFLTCGRWQHYHQPTDTPDRLDYPKMAQVRDYLVRVAGALARADLPSEGPRPREHDTTAFELSLLGDALGETGARYLAMAVGLARLETRADLDALAARLQGYFDL